jgi:hypothetical protein
MAGGIISIPYTTPVLSSAGIPLANCTLFIANTGTSTAAQIFSDSGLTTPISNPLLSDTAGRFLDQSTVIWGPYTQAVDATLTLSDGEGPFQFDTIYPQAAPVNTSGFLSNPSVALTGSPTSTTPSVGDNSSAIATTAFVVSLTNNFAPIANPNFTGIPTAPTANSGTISTQIATTAFVSNSISTAIGNIQGTLYANMSIAATILTINLNNGFASITRTGTGTISFIFSTARTNTNYCVFFGIQNATQLQCVLIPSSKATTGFTAQILENNNSPSDSSGLSVQVVG